MVETLALTLEAGVLRLMRGPETVVRERGLAAGEAGAVRV